MFIPSRRLKANSHIQSFNQSLKMGQGDYIPPARKRRYDPKHAAAIKQGGKKAQKILKNSSHEHLAVEVPAAEEELLKDLETLDENSNKNNRESTDHA